MTAWNETSPGVWWPGGTGHARDLALNQDTGAIVAGRGSGVWFSWCMSRQGRDAAEWLSAGEGTGFAVT